jgi:dolichol-phosphate mannosyltransferase
MEPVSPSLLKPNLALSIIVPIYNDGYLIEPFCQAIQKEFRAYFNSSELRSRIEVIFVNDGSRNDSDQLMEKAKDGFDFVETIHFSRNFGQHVAISCGYRMSSGQMVSMMNVDQEDPIDQLIKMVDHMKSTGCDVVHGLYAQRRVSFVNRITSTTFNLVMNYMTGQHLPLNTSTVRVLNRRFVNQYNRLKESQRYIPALELWLGFKHEYIPVEHRPRSDKRSSYNFVRRLKMAVNAIVSFSDLPLKMASVVGFAFAFSGFLMLLAIVIRKLIGIEILIGFTATIAAIVLFGGMSILVTGLAGLYVGSILREVQDRPLYIISKSTFGVEE